MYLEKILQKGMEFKLQIDATHAAYHAGKAVVESIKGNHEQASRDWGRAKNHASGEIFHQRQRSKSK